MRALYNQSMNEAKNSETMDLKFKRGALEIIKPSDQIKYPYLLYVPEKLDRTRPVEVFLWGHGSQSANNVMDQAEEVKNTGIRHSILRGCDETGLILLTPILPLKQGEQIILDTQIMHRDTTVYQKDDPEQDIFFQRPDKEVLKMITQVNANLINSEYKTSKKVVVGGISAGANFANRFSMLYPHLVKAAVIMSAGNYMYPISEMDEVNLEYPFGTEDIRKITGSDFDLDLFKQIPHFVYIGEKDDNPGPLEYDASGRSGWATSMKSVLGTNRNQLDHNYVNFLKKLDMDITFVARDDLRHSPDNKVIQEMYEFLKRIEK